MESSHFARFAPVIRTLTPIQIGAADPPDDLLMDRGGNLAIYYAPFDYINPDARIILVGITPGRTQMNEALTAAAACLANGRNEQEVLRTAKETASFAGPVRHPRR
jgi:hypothetical protein